MSLSRFIKNHPMLELMDMFVDDGFQINKFNGFKKEQGVYYLEVPVAGYKKSELKIEVDEHNVYVTGSRSSRDRNESISKMFSLPEDGDLSTVKIDVNDGMLYISMNTKHNRFTRRTLEFT